MSHPPSLPVRASVSHHLLVRLAEYPGPKIKGRLKRQQGRLGRFKWKIKVLHLKESTITVWYYLWWFITASNRAMGVAPIPQSCSHYKRFSCDICFASLLAASSISRTHTNISACNRLFLARACGHALGMSAAGRSVRPQTVNTTL